MRQEHHRGGRISATPTSLISAFLGSYERFSVTGRAIFWGALVVFVGFWLDFLIGLLPLPWIPRLIAENSIEGIFFTFLIWAFLNARDKRRQQRSKEISYLNHHIRNSLTVIEFAESHDIEEAQHSEMVKNASRRIRRCIEKISNEENCEINNDSPENP